jgi:shikimate dehydrogenase
MESRISGTTRVLTLIGSPVGHSGSPAMHNYAAQLLGLDYVYVAFDVSEEQTADAMQAIRSLGIRGTNVTMPCKTAAAIYADRLSPAASLIAACNTIVNDDGVLTGYTTDGEGYVAALRDRGIDIRGKKVLLAGAGGAACAIAAQCALDGARSVTFLLRRGPSWSRAQALSGKIRAVCPACELALLDIADTGQVRAALADCDIFSNATSVGMLPGADTSILDGVMEGAGPRSVLRPDLIVTDAVYNPVRTRLLRDAEAAGCTTVDGLAMLLWQGAAAFKLFTGHDMPVREVEERFFS